MIRLSQRLRLLSRSNVFTRRDIFSDASLSIDVFAEKRSRAVQEMPKDVTISTLAAAVAALDDPGGCEEGQRCVKNAIYMAKDEDSLRQTGRLVEDFLSKFKLTCPEAAKVWILRDLISACHIARAEETATALWQSTQDICSTTDESERMVANVPALTLCYLDLLYKSNKFEAVCNEVETILKNVKKVPPNIYVIYMMSCLCLDTPEALARASRHLAAKDPEVLDRIGKVSNAYALLALKHNRPCVSYEVVSRPHTKPSKVRSCLKAFVCAKTGRPAGACRALEELCKGVRGEQPFPLPSEAIEAVIRAVEEGEDDVVLSKELNDTLGRISEFSVISPTTMKDLIAGEIQLDRHAKHKRQANRDRLARKHSRNDDLKPEQEFAK